MIFRPSTYKNGDILHIHQTLMTLHNFFLGAKGFHGHPHDKMKQLTNKAIQTIFGAIIGNSVDCTAGNAQAKVAEKNVNNVLQKNPKTANKILFKSCQQCDEAVNQKVIRILSTTINVHQMMKTL